MRQSPISKLQWLVPISVAIHNLEEVFTLEWSRSTYAGILPAQLAILDNLTSKQFFIATSLITIAVFAGTAYGWKKNPRGFDASFLLFVEAVMFVNAFSHIITGFWLGGYTPGLLTAVLFNIPLPLYFFYRMKQEGFLASKQLMRLLGIAVLLMPLLAGLALWLGWMVGI